MEQILVIDDQADLRDNVSELLKLEGYIVYKAADGASGIEMAKLGRPDLIICDIQMPDTDGFDVLSSLGSDPVTSSIPFIFLTGLANLEMRCKGRDSGADDYLVKPFYDRELICAIKSRLNKSKLLKNDRENDRLAYTQEFESAIHRLSHHVRAPLCSLLGLVNLLDLEDLSDAEKKQILCKIRSSAEMFDGTTSELTVQMLTALAKSKLNS